jgi:lysine 2,3-aminomutase
VGQRLMRSLRRTVSGLCLPTYVLDIPGGFGKVPIGPMYVGARDASGCRQIQDSDGTSHSYPE